MPSPPEFQQTVGKIAGFTGTALHTGEKVTLRLHPAPVDHGIKFKRKDLQDEPTIDAKIENLKTVERATTIGEGSVRVHTVEHVLAALCAMGVETRLWKWTQTSPQSAMAVPKRMSISSVRPVLSRRKSRENSLPRETRYTSNRKRARCSFCCRTTNF